MGERSHMLVLREFGRSGADDVSVFAARSVEAAQHFKSSWHRAPTHSDGPVHAELLVHEACHTISDGARTYATVVWL